MTVVTVAVVPVDIVRIEVHVPRVVRVVRIERRRPIVAVGAGIVKIVVVAIARSREASGMYRSSDFLRGNSSLNDLERQFLRRQVSNDICKQKERRFRWELR